MIGPACDELDIAPHTVANQLSALWQEVVKIDVVLPERKPGVVGNLSLAERGSPLRRRIRLGYTGDMAQRATPPPFLTVDEYLELEEGSSIKHEYVEGALYALAGSSLRHNRSTINILRALDAAAEGTPRQVYTSDVRCRVGDVFYYPDVMVACGEPKSGGQVYRSDPCLLVEVTSPSTASKDRREKLLIYRQIPTVQAYLIVDQDTRRVERHYRDHDGVWQRADHLNDGAIPVPCPETELTLDGIYRDIP